MDRAARGDVAPAILAGVARHGGAVAPRRLAFLLELVPALLLGFALQRRWPGLCPRLSPLLVHWGVPLSVMGLLLRSGLDARFADVLLLTLGLVAAALLLNRLPGLRSVLPGPVEQWGAVVGNTAYFGIPAALALLPPQAVGYSVAYDLAATLFTWSLGPLLFGGGAPALGPLIGGLLTSPALRGLVAALLVQATPWADGLAALLWWPARLVLLASLMVVGGRMGAVLGRPLPRQLWLPLAMKLLLFPAAVLGVLQLLGVPELVRAAVVLQAATPTAVSVLLLVEVRGGSPVEPAAALVLWSTLLALGTVPLWARLLMA